MLSRLISREINYEMIAIFIFIVISGSYIIIIHGPAYLVENMFLSIFSASIVIFLTLIVVKIIEHAHNRQKNKYAYIDWRKRR
jgi:hypothetical protein